MFIKVVFQHLKIVFIHKWYVFKNCCKAGIVWRGITHDMSKFSPTEFFESIKYFTGKCSPIITCKKINGYSNAWLHHRGRNPHHYEYWVDHLDHGGQPIEMPYEDALELICDYIAAGQAYMKKDFSYQAEYDWWVNKKSAGIAMHPNTVKFVDQMLAIMKATETNDCLKCAKEIYQNS